MLPISIQAGSRVMTSELHAESGIQVAQSGHTL